MAENYLYISSLGEQIPEIPPDSIISRTFYQDDRVKAILFGFAVDQELSEHTASKPAILHFIEGRANLTLGDKSFEVKGGSWVHMQPNLAHSIKAMTELRMLLIML